jgi:hypothetical protein
MEVLIGYDILFYMILEKRHLSYVYFNEMYNFALKFDHFHESSSLRRKLNQVLSFVSIHKILAATQISNSRTKNI